MAHPCLIRLYESKSDLKLKNKRKIALLHFKTFISNLWLSGNHSIAVAEIWRFEGKQKIDVFKKMGFTNMQKGMVPWLEIYFLISKTNLETFNFVLKLRSLKKIEIHTVTS